MTIRILILIIPCVIFLSSCESTIVEDFKNFDGWEYVSSGTKNNLYDIFFIDNTNGFSCGSNGTIIKSIDGGKSWESLTSPTSLTLYSVSFTSSTNGWVAGGLFQSNQPREYALYHTTNAGKDWLEIDLKINNAVFSKIQFIDSLNGWLLGISNERSLFYRTTDGGNSWELLENNFKFGLPTSMQFLSKSVGYVVGDGFIARTVDGGISFIITDRIAESYTYINTVYFINDSLGWFAGWNSRIQKTTNSGFQWDRLLAEQNQMYDLYSIRFVNEFVGWVGGSSGALFRTGSGGISWEQKNTGFNSRIYSIFFIDNSNGWFCGEKGIIYNTRTGGI